MSEIVLNTRPTTQLPQLLRLLGGAAIALIVTFLLYWLMATLVAAGREAMTEGPSGRIVDFVRVKKDQDLNVDQKKPEKPQKPQAAPDTPQPQQNDNQNPDANTVNIGPMNVANDVSLQNGFGLSASDGEYLPIVKVAPIYPDSAARRGLEGWVLLKFTVTETGAVRDPVVLESEPGTTFDRVMSYNSSDDGVEFFGGVMNVSNLIVVGAEDDSIDTDTGVKANLQNVIAIQRPGFGDTIIEADSSNGLEEDTPRQNVKISNATFIANSGVGDQAIRIRGFADFTIVNSVLIDQSGNTPCLRVDNPETLNRAANASIDEAGPVVFNSFVLDCATDFRDGSGGVTAADVQTRFNAGSNNNAGFTNTLSMTFINGANENGVAVFDPTSLGSFFTLPTNIGAVYPGNNTWFQGWTCNSATVTFDTAVSDCTSLPIY